MRLIDADAFKEKLNSFHIVGGRGYGKTECQRYLNKKLSEIIGDVPTADVEPVRHGRWIRGASKGWPTKPSCLWYCSCCGEKIKYVDTLRTYQKIKRPINEVNPYCRKCGAKMDGGDSNENS